MFINLCRNYIPRSSDNITQGRVPCVNVWSVNTKYLYSAENLDISAKTYDPSQETDIMIHKLGYCQQRALEIILESLYFAAAALSEFGKYSMGFKVNFKYFEIRSGSNWPIDSLPANSKSS